MLADIALDNETSINSHGCAKDFSEVLRRFLRLRKLPCSKMGLIITPTPFLVETDEILVSRHIHSARYHLPPYRRPRLRQRPLTTKSATV